MKDNQSGKEISYTSGMTVNTDEETIEFDSEAGSDYTITFEKYKLADYTLVDAALAKVPANLSIYTRDSAANLEKAVKGVDRTITVDRQEEVDAMAAAIEAAIKALVLQEVVDIAQARATLQSLIKEAEVLIGRGQGNYTDVSWKRLVSAVSEGKNLAANSQADLAALRNAAATINDARAQLAQKPSGNQDNGSGNGTNDGQGNGSGDKPDNGSDSDSGTETLAAPTAAKAASAGYNAVRVSWKKVSQADGYELYKKESKAKKYVKVKSVKGTSYTCKGLTTGKKVSFRVRAYKKLSGKTVYGPYGKTVSATPVPVTVTKVQKSSVKRNSVTIRWKKVSGASGYQVVRATKKNGKYKTEKTITKGSTVKYVSKKLSSKKTYYYKVRAYRKVGKKKIYGKYSSAVAVKTK